MKSLQLKKGMLMKDSSQVVIEAPLSFTGSSKRINKIWSATDNAAVKWAILLPSIVLLYVICWSFILCWYVFFGICLVPYRLIRRSSRKQKRDTLRHQEMLNAIQNKSN